MNSLGALPFSEGKGGRVDLEKRGCCGRDWEDAICERKNKKYFIKIKERKEEGRDRKK